MPNSKPPTPAQEPHRPFEYRRDESVDPLVEEGAMDIREVIARLWRGLPQTLGFAALGLGLAAVAFFVTSGSLAVTTSTRVVFSFAGYERGEYPDHSKFQPNDMGAPDIVTEALKRQGLDTTEESQGRVRAALTIEGVIPANVIKERDRLRAAGQAPPLYRPDEYLVSLSLPRNFPLGARKRELLLGELVNVYREHFQATYSSLPVAFGNAFDTLRNADYFDYELVLNQEIQNVLAYLNQQLEIAKTFRSPTTNLSFNDLHKQVEIFNQVRLTETLGLIRLNGLSRDRHAALVKTDYYLRTLQEQEQRAIEEEGVVKELLARTAERSQGYVLGVKSQSTLPRQDALLVDQSLIDSLLAHDSYNFLVREALKSGLQVKRIQAEESIVRERRKVIEDLINKNEKGSALDQVIARVTKSLDDIEVDYRRLIANIRKTQEEFAKQEYADAVRISMQVKSESFYRKLAIASIVGLCIGTALGMGLSLLGVYVGGHRDKASPTV